MKKKRLLTTIGILGVALAGWWTTETSGTAAATKYEFARVELGRVEAVISATGTLSAVETVAVGTEISGTVAEVLADYNDQVHRGQLLAMIDTDLLDAGVREAEAGLARAQAELVSAESELSRLLPLYVEGLVSEREQQAYETLVRTAEASVLSATAVLDRAARNRDNAEIRSPIDGIVIERAVERGQTVSASLSAPTLFVLAEDLTNMEILANVDESDIGQIRQGQLVRFTVAAYPDEVFSGVVEEVRLLPEVISNVVNYTVVVEADNARGFLLPGMTATLDFVVEGVDEALVVPSAALRVQPTAEMVEQVRVQRGGGRSSTTNAPEGGDPRGGDRTAGVERGSRAEDVSRLWYLDDSGDLQVALVRTGVTDGLRTEIILLAGPIKNGTEVISRVDGGVELAKGSHSSNDAMRGGRRLGL